MAERTVNQRQQDVLRWIHDGCPAGRWSEGDTSYKTTAVALKGRRLVTITKKKGVWSAKVTDAGRYFVEHGEYPDGHWAPVEPPKTVQQVRARETPKKVTGLRPVDQLMLDLKEAGGTLVVKDRENYYGNLASAATRYGKVPEGQLLEVTRGPRYDQRTVRLVDKPEWMTKVLEPVPVPERLSKPHPAVAALRADKARLKFKQPVRTRAVLLLNTLSKEAVKRGYVVTGPKPHRGYYNQGDKWDLRIDIGEHHTTLNVSEDTDKTPHEPTAKELKDQAENRWAPRIPKYDHTPSGRLVFTLNGQAVRQANFGDTKTLNLNDRLAEVLQEVELRAQRDEEAQLKRERAAAERRTVWEQTRADAVVRFGEQHKAQTLAERAALWREHVNLGGYLAALAEQIQPLTGDARAAADEWFTWAQTHHAATNPLTAKTLFAPEVPTPSPEQLRPFMGGLDPYGPRDW